MKVEIENGFKPVEVKILLESEDEVAQFCCLMNVGEGRVKEFTPRKLEGKEFKTTFNFWEKIGNKLCDVIK